MNTQNNLQFNHERKICLWNNKKFKLIFHDLITWQKAFDKCGTIILSNRIHCYCIIFHSFFILFIYSVNHSIILISWPGSLTSFIPKKNCPWTFLAILFFLMGRSRVVSSNSCWGRRGGMDMSANTHPLTPKQKNSAIWAIAQWQLP